MRLKPLFLLVLAAGGLRASLALAQLPPPSAQLDQLISSGQYQQAYDIATTNLTVWEGDIQFDFLYGIAALESGYPNEAIFAFERVVQTADNATLRQRARLELARAHLLTNNLNASENLFNQVMQTNPPQNVRDNIEAFLSLIESRRDSLRTTFTWSIAPTIGHDDNINSATSNGLIDTPLIGEIELNPDGLKTADSFADLTLGLAYKIPLTRDQSIDASINLNRHDNQSTNQFDMDYILGDVSYSYGGQTNRFRHSLQAQKVYLDKTAFQSTLRINNSWQHAGGNGWYQNLSASLSTTRFDDTTTSPRNHLKDTNQILVSGTLTKLTQSFTNSFTVFYAMDDAIESAGKHNGRSYYGIAHSTQWRINNRHTPYLRISLQETEHDTEHPVFFRDKRSDSTLSGTLGWQWQYSRRLSINSEMLFTEADSNIPLFEHTRFRYQAGFRFQL
ncbi:MAG: hypothetical protein Q8L20_09400 [Gammaproteobacteria bacterium]|nr:hypothetical protein [Gammaproteobacteria bacterium]